jgi:hypothetical protein
MGLKFQHFLFLIFNLGFFRKFLYFRSGNWWKQAWNLRG